MKPLGIAAVVLTRGDRPDALGRALGSLRSQVGEDLSVVVVANGVDRHRLEPEVNALADTVVTCDTNVGIPEGRNVGMETAQVNFESDLVLFLDDDAELCDSGTLQAVATRFASDPQLAAVCLRLVDELGVTASRHIPRPGRRSAYRSGPVASFLGGAVVMRSSAFSAVGGYCGPFFYAMEETDLALRLVDGGWSLWFDADHRVFHPRVVPSRHGGAARRTARNRVWLAHRSLPLPVAVLYVANWLVIGAIRSPRQLRNSLAGFIEGIRHPVGPRRPVSWATVWRLTRLGRPPIV